MRQHRPMTEAEAKAFSADDEAAGRMVRDWRSYRAALAALGRGWTVDRMIDGTWMWCGPDGSIHTLPDTGPIPHFSEALLAAFERRPYDDARSA